jgi:hypothetical protein
MKTPEETAAYAKGYNAGRRRKKIDRSAEQRRRQENALWQRAVLSALPFAVTQDTWTRGKVKINSLEDRVKLAGEIATCVVNETHSRGRL